MYRSRMMLLFAATQPQLTFSGTFPANPYPGQTGLAPKYPLVDSLPATVADGQRFRLAEAGREFGREYLGRSVVEMNVGGSLSVPSSSYVFKQDSLDIYCTFRDTIAGTSDYEGIIAIGASNGIFMQVARTNDMNLYLQLQNEDNSAFLFQITNTKITDNNWHTLHVLLDVNRVSVELDGVVFVTCEDITGWTPNPPLHTYIQPAIGLTPFQVCNIQQSLNGVLIDNIPCTETSGATLANTATPSRLATLSDASVHALAWVPQDAVTMAVWQSRKSFNNSGIDLVHIPSFPALEELYRANSPVTITTELTFNVDNVNAGVVVWGDTTSDYNMAIKQRTSNSLWCAINSGEAAISGIAIQNGLFARLVASKSSSEASISCNGVSKTDSGSFAFSFANKGIYVGGHTDGENTEGCFHSVKIYSGYTATSDVSGLTLVDSIDFNDKSQWTGGASGTTKNGNPFTVTDGTPTGAYSSCWYPLSNQ